MTILDAVQTGNKEGLLQAAMQLVRESTECELQHMGGIDGALDAEGLSAKLKAAYAETVMVRRQKETCTLLKSKTFDKEETRSVLKTLVHFLTVTQHQSMEVLDGETVMERIDALSEDKSTPLHAEAKKELRNWARSITPIQMKSYFDCRLSAEVEVGVPTAVASMTASTHMHPFHMHPFHTCIHCDPFVIPHMCIHSASR